MNPPRLLAIENVHLTAPAASRAALVEFYVDLLGFEHLDDADGPDRVKLRGLPRSGPRLLIDLVEEPADKPMRRRALLQVDGLGQYAEALKDRRIPYEWVRGWFFFDRRICLLDPGGNWIELISSHRL
jgi:catechol 2,3-dioxygenase-like lactoylglutathione lyase family enzyme